MIWINAIWRTGSTYIWHKYRQTGLCHCYLEPFHELMLDLDPVQHRAAFLAGEPRLLRHPELSEPCFAEYPVRPQGGVPGYLKRFGYERYVLEEGDEDPELQSYIAGLVAWCNERGRTCVFQPNRALLRSDWLCRRFGFFHIFLVRHPWDVWHSMMSYPVLYFPAAILNTVNQNRNSPYFSPLLARYPIPVIQDANCQFELARHAEFARDHPAILEPIFFYFFAVACLYNLACCDVVLDMNAVSAAALRAREAAECEIAKGGVPIGFDDCNVPKYHISFAEVERHHKIENEICELLTRASLPRLTISRTRFNALRTDLSEYMVELCGRFVA